MFEEFFHLKENPFSLAPNPRFLFRSHQHDEALAHLRYWIENAEGFVMITGEVGTGKTTALYDLLAQLPTDWSIAVLTHSTLNALELLEEICRKFHIEVPDGCSKPKMLGLIEAYLVDCRRRGHGALLIIDEAQNLDQRMLEEVRLLSNMERVDGKLLQIALVGQPELESKLRSAELRQLRQRIGIKHILGPLSGDEAVDYIQHRVRVAGGVPAQVFPRDACLEVFELTNGIPREINVVASQALINAFVQEAPAVRPSHVQAVVDDFSFKSIVRPGARTEEPSAPAFTKTVEQGEWAGRSPRPGPGRQEMPRAGQDGVRRGALPTEPPAHSHPPSGAGQRPPTPILGVVGGGQAAERAADLADEPEAIDHAETAPPPEPPAAEAAERPRSTLRGYPRPLAPPPRRRGERPTWPWLLGVLLAVLLIVWLVADNVSDNGRADSRDAGDAAPKIPTSVPREIGDPGVEPAGGDGEDDGTGGVDDGEDDGTGEVDDRSSTVDEQRRVQLASTSLSRDVRPAADPEPPPIQERILGRYYTVHVASFRNQERANRFKLQCETTFGESVSIVDAKVHGELWHRIYLGRFESSRGARALAKQVKETGLVTAAVVTVRAR